MPDTPKLTIAYLTARQNPLWRWFVDSLARQAQGDYSWFEVVVIDLWAEAHAPGDNWTAKQAAARRAEFAREMPFPFRHSAPIWGPWQGPHRLTREQWFAKADYLNAAVCLARAPSFCCCDDLSVLQPGWLEAVRTAAAWRGITCGAYRKARKMVVEDGVVLSYEDHPGGHDHRWKYGNDSIAVPCPPNWMYGYFVTPVEAIVRANGWPQMSAGMGFEDAPMGTVLGRAGWSFRYDRRMMAWESEEHHVGGVNSVGEVPGFALRRADPCKGNPDAKPRDDKSHALLAAADDPSRTGWPENVFGGGGTLADVRALVQAGGALPVCHLPTHDWFTGKGLGSPDLDVA